MRIGRGWGGLPKPRERCGRHLSQKREGEAASAQRHKSSTPLPLGPEQRTLASSGRVRGGRVRGLGVREREREVRGLL